MNLHKQFQIATDVFFPGTCLNCGIILLARHRFDACSPLERHLTRCLCLQCRRRIRIVNWQTCACQKSVSDELSVCDFCTHFPEKPDAMFSCYSFHEPINRLVRHLKYSRREEIGRWLADLMLLQFCSKMQRMITVHKIESITFVPMTWRRQHKRGYNQAEIIANRLATELDLKVEKSILKRIRKVTPQVRITTIADRYENVRDAFEAKDCTGKRLLLIDDVMTTGSTLSACSRALKFAGADRVVSLTAATAASRFPSQFLVDEMEPAGMI